MEDARCPRVGSVGSVRSRPPRLTQRLGADVSKCEQAPCLLTLTSWFHNLCGNVGPQIRQTSVEDGGWHLVVEMDFKSTTMRTMPCGCKVCEQITHQMESLEIAHLWVLTKVSGNSVGRGGCFHKWCCNHSMTTCKKRTSTLLSKLGKLALDTGHRSS